MQKLGYGRVERFQSKKASVRYGIKFEEISKVSLYLLGIKKGINWPFKLKFNSLNKFT
jgi:hypothetical protein